MAREGSGLLSLRSWYELEENEGAVPYEVPGAFYRGRLDRERWVTAGVGEELPFQVRSSRVYLPPEVPPSAARRVVGTVDPDDGRISGHAWEESDERLPGAVLAYEERVGEGRVVAFTEDPNFRGYARGTSRLFLNAAVLGPSAP